MNLILPLMSPAKTPRANRVVTVVGLVPCAGRDRLRPLAVGTVCGTGAREQNSLSTCVPIGRSQRY
jgi:hypothetical protein